MRGKWTCCPSCMTLGCDKDLGEDSILCRCCGKVYRIDEAVACSECGSKAIEYAARAVAWCSEHNPSRASRIAGPFHAEEPYVPGRRPGTVPEVTGRA